MRKAFIVTVTQLLPKLYIQHKTIYDSICAIYPDQQGKDVRKLHLELLATRLIFEASQSVPTGLSTEGVPMMVGELVTTTCYEMRAMDKEMRIYCAGLLTKIHSYVPTFIVI